MHRYHDHHDNGRPHHGRFYKSLFWGVAFIAAGTVFLLDRLGIVSTHDALLLWPVLIALFGVMRIVRARGLEHVAKGVFAIVFAGWIYACIEQLWGWTFVATWPIILIALGVKAVAVGIVSLRKPSSKEIAQ